MTEPGARARNRAQVAASLLEAGRRQLAEVGAAALSVRAVARDMGMAPSALFRYIASRDELLTLLIVDAYDELGAFVEQVEGDVPRADLRGRWRALAHGVRDWAVAHPHEWALLFGSPVPGYDAPGDQTNPAGQRASAVLARVGADLAATGAGPDALGDDGDVLAAAAVAVLSDGPALPPVLFTHGLLAWTGLIGAVNLIVFETLGRDLAESDALFAYAVRANETLIFGSA